MLEQQKDNLPKAEGTSVDTIHAAQDTLETPNTTAQQEDAGIAEIDHSNAADAEDMDTRKRHDIPMLDYDTMSIEALNLELDRLVSSEKVQTIKNHVAAIKAAFDVKYHELVEQKKEDFLAQGGNVIDFHFQSKQKQDFYAIYNTYRDKRSAYQKAMDKAFEENLKVRLALIEELKQLENVEENINTTYKQFNDIQERWRSAGPIARTKYNDTWNTYHFYVERFYDVLNLNRKLRDLDFKRNLEKKQEIIAKAESLTQEPDSNKAFRELQLLHKIWKEDIGPVAHDIREEIWQSFSAATKTIHDKRQEFFDALEASYQENLAKKQEIIIKIDAITNDIEVASHNQWQKLIKEIEQLRESFFKAGKVPQKDNEATWDIFKTAVRAFNQKKNIFYKDLKKEQQTNLDKKLALVALAESLKDSTDWAETTPKMKRIQSDWKKIGHVPRKHSDKIWKDFKSACNHYFDALHDSKADQRVSENNNLIEKEQILEELKSFTLTQDREQNLTQIKAFIARWKAVGKIPFAKKNIENKFHKIIDALFKKLDLDRQEAELIKYGDRIEQLSNSKDAAQIQREMLFIRKKIDETVVEIRQLENNLAFFSNLESKSPILKDALKNIQKQKDSLALWKIKLQKVKDIENQE